MVFASGLSSCFRACCQIWSEVLLDGGLTTSMASPSAAALFFSLALARAVVERTAVTAFVIVSFLGGFVDAGYANKLGLAFEMYWN